MATTIITNHATMSTPTITASRNVDSTSIRARIVGTVLFLEGYVVVKAQTYTANDTVLFSTDALPSGIRFFNIFDSKAVGSTSYVGKIFANGEIKFNNTISFTANTYLFFNAAIQL